MLATDEPIVTIQNRKTLSQAGKLVNKSPSCIFRWCRDGVAGVKLDHARYGGSLFTSEAALDRFAQRVAQARGSGAGPSTNSPRRLNHRRSVVA